MDAAQSPEAAPGAAEMGSQESATALEDAVNEDAAAQPEETFEEASPSDEAADASSDAGKAAEATTSQPVTLPADFEQRVEAVLLGTDRPMPAAKIGELLGGVPGKAVNQAVAALNEVYEQTQRSFRIEQVAGGWQILTLPQFADVLAALHKTKAKGQLSPAALETLAIIAYKQPILRADVESIRGVACGETIRTLMERNLVKIVGRAEEIGRPMLYGTTKQFLEVFGLSSLKDLPKVEELRSGE